MKKPANLSMKEPVTSKRTKAISESYESRKQKYQELKELRQMLKDKKEKYIQHMQNERKRLEGIKRQKEINMIKSGKYEIIKDVTKIKKWKRKARQMLQKLPPEIFYENTK
jgi:hypothetical protein